jgi:EAL domain-containing protein (putative c-di-GMP-specific phosphodiesterase class I)
VTRDRHPQPAVAQPLPALGQELQAIRDRFAACGAMALLLVDTSVLDAVERRFGAAAQRQVTGRIAQRLREALEGALCEDDVIATGEFGRTEIHVLFLRERKDQAFHLELFPRLIERVTLALAEVAPRIGYPFVRDRMRLPLGSAVVFYDPMLRPELILRRARDRALEDAALTASLQAKRLREELVRVLISEDVQIVFEPIVNLARREVFGFEALVRGREGSDLMTPHALFSVAQDEDMLFEMDCLCRRAALAEAKRIPPGAKLFVNCLPSAIHDPAFEGDALRRSLQDHRLRPGDIVLEISERESIENFTIFREVCDHYAELGFQIALDDVGVGYGSLEAVTELRPDFIKVDIAFVRGIDTDPARQEVLVAMNSIARRIGAHIVAEGIETPEQLETLRRMAIPLGQGYLLGRAARLQDAP